MRQFDVPDLATGLSIVNSRAVCHILEGGSNHYSCRCFETPNDWKHAKDIYVPSCDILVDDLVAAKVHVNNFGEIGLGAPMIPITDNPGDNVGDPSGGNKHADTPNFSGSAKFGGALGGEPSVLGGKPFGLGGVPAPDFGGCGNSGSG